MGSNLGGLNKDHTGGGGLGSCVYHISPLHPSTYLRLWHRELLSKSQAVFKITRSQKRGISHMIISIVPHIKHIQKLYTVINDSETV